MAVSKTRMLELIKVFDYGAVDLALTQSEALRDWRDERGRNWLHLTCGTPLTAERSAADSLATADVLLKHGLPLDREAFTEGDWKATPLWFAIARGHNLALAEHLLKLGCNPNYCLWAAGWDRNLEAIRLLLRHGADVNDPSVAGEPPFIGATKTSRFEAAEVLLEAGADVDTLDGDGMTGLHLMLKKNSDKAFFPMLIAHGARGDIPDKAGVTARDIMRRKRDPDSRRMAEALA